MATRRSLHLDSSLLQAYSRRGNFHTDLDEARRLGLPGLVAQGMQVAGPAYGLLLDAWGADFLARGDFDLRFVAPVTAGQTVDAEIALDGDDAELTVSEADRVVVTGTARARGNAT